MWQKASRRMKVLGAAGIASALFVLLFAVLRSGDGNQPLPSIPQDASSISGSIRIRARSAIFSGTETLLRIETEDSSGERMDFAVMAESIRVQGFDGPYRDGTTAGAGQATVRLPRVLADESPIVKISALIVISGGETSTVAGEWELPLTLPSPPDLQKMLTVLTSSASSSASADITISATGVLSASSFELEYSLPNGVSELKPPRIVEPSGKVSFAIRGGRLDESSRVASFVAPKSYGPITVEFGPLVIGTTEGATARLAVDAGDALFPEPGRAGVPLKLISVEDGDTNLVEALYLESTSNGTHVLAIVLRGNWPSEIENPKEGNLVSWTVTDSAGGQLEPKYWEENYTKSDAGVIGYGRTKIGVRVADVDVLSTIQVTTSRKAKIIDGEWRIAFDLR